METLTQDQVDAFNENGFLRLEKVFDAETVARQSQELERLMQEWATQGPGWKGPWRQAYMTAEEDQRARLDILSDLPSYSEEFYRAVTDDKLVGAVADLLGTSVEYHHTVLHAKGPEMGTPFPMHQDHPFYAHEGPGYIDALLHIDDATEANGCLKFSAGQPQARSAAAYRTRRLQGHASPSAGGPIPAGRRLARPPPTPGTWSS